MDIFDWIRKHKMRAALIAFALFIVLPYGIDKLYSSPALFRWLAMGYSSADVLAFYGIALGSATTVLALIETIQHTEKMHSLDYERKLTPLLDSNIYNHTDSSITPLRSLYVNLRPTAYYDKISVLPSVDPRDFESLFYGTQIDYLIQNISETSAVNINVYLNDMLLHGPFSLVAGSEASIGIFFFDEQGRLIGTFPHEVSFDLKITYTNANKSKKFTQTEKIVIEHIFMSLHDDPPLMPKLDARTGLSHATTET